MRVRTAPAPQLNPRDLLLPSRPWTTWLPLGIVLGVSLIKEAIEDYKRYKADREVNNREVLVLNTATQAFEPKRWQDIHAGEIVEVTRDTYFPADLLFLTAENEEGVCYIETMNLDGWVPCMHGAWQQYGGVPNSPARPVHVAWGYLAHLLRIRHTVCHTCGLKHPCALCAPCVSANLRACTLRASTLAPDISIEGTAGQSLSLFAIYPYPPNFPQLNLNPPFLIVPVRPT